MFKHYFEGIQNVEVYPIISLLIFFAFFVGLFLWISGLSKRHINDMKNLPLEEDEEVIGKINKEINELNLHKN